MFIKIVDTKGKKKKCRKEEPITFEDIQKVAVKTFGENAKSCSIAYLDTSDEVMYLTNQDELDACLEEMHQEQSDKRIKTLTLRLVDKIEEGEGARPQTRGDLPDPDLNQTLMVDESILLDRRPEDSLNFSQETPGDAPDIESEEIGGLGENDPELYFNQFSKKLLASIDLGDDDEEEESQK